MTTSDTWTAADDQLHPPGEGHYETETFWFSFFVPERRLGAWLYASVKQNIGVTAGGMWIWDDSGSNFHEIPFFEQFGHLKLPTSHADGRIDFPTGMSVGIREPGMSYDLRYSDRRRVEVDLVFTGVEPMVPLRAGAPPYPIASHYDQTGHVTGTVVLDGETIPVDCYAMRDRSWGPRMERGYGRVGYTWASSADLSFLTYTSPKDGHTGPEDVYAGYVRRDGELAQITGGKRTVHRDLDHGWLTGMELELTDELGRTTTAHAESVSRLVLPGSTSLCLNTSLRWDVEGTHLHGEDQDVWSLAQWRQHRKAPSTS